MMVIKTQHNDLTKEKWWKIMISQRCYKKIITAWLWFSESWTSFLLKNFALTKVIAEIK